MLNYVKQLKEAGMSESRIFAIGASLSSLHSEICKLDLKNLRLFMKGGLAGNLQKYAKAEDLRDVVSEHFEERVARSLKMFDTEEHNFRAWSEVRREALEDMLELEIPGAGVAYAALQKMRASYEETHEPEIPVDRPLLKDHHEQHELVKRMLRHIDETKQHYEDGLLTPYEYVLQLLQPAVGAFEQLREDDVELKEIVLEPVPQETLERHLATTYDISRKNDADRTFFYLHDVNTLSAEEVRRLGTFHDFDGICLCDGVICVARLDKK